MDGAGRTLLVARLALAIVRAAELPLFALALGELVVITDLGASSATRAFLLLFAALTISYIGPLIADAADREIERRIERQLDLLMMATVNSFRGLAPFENPRLRDDLYLAQDAASNAPLEIVRTGFTLIQSALSLLGLIGIAASIGIGPVLLAILSLVPLLVTTILSQQRSVNHSMAIASTMRRKFLFQELQLSARAASEIRVFNLGDYFLARMEREIARAHTSARKLDLQYLRQAMIASTFLIVCLGIAVLVGLSRSREVGPSASTVAVLVTALMSMVAVAEQLMASLSGVWATYQRFGAVQRIVEAAGNSASDLPCDAVKASGDLARTEAKNERAVLSLKDVWFRFSKETNWVLKGVDLTLAEGEIVALVGPNGAGKTTLLKLALGLYEPEVGSLLWRGRSRALDYERARNETSALFQDFMQYEMTIHDNIGLGCVEFIYDRTQVMEAAIRADIADTIAGLPRQYDTMLTRSFEGDPDDEGDSDDQLSADTGILLSGGQWQRLALARAIRRPASVVFLDEPTTAMDPISEDRFMEQISELLKGKTALLVSHRMALARMADRIIVLEDGAITAEGTHETLTANDRSGGFYAESFRKQAIRYGGLSQQSD